MAVLLSCSDIVKSFGSRILFESLSLTISDGDRIGLIGPNGSGKTTLLEILAGNDAPDSGTRAVRQSTRVAYVPQDSQFGKEDTIASVLRGAIAHLPLEQQERDARLQMAFGRAGFKDTDTRAAALSGGWKKRLAIASALITSPDLLILDEPTNHLDLEGILWLEETVKAANACLVVTHDRYFLENVSTRVIEIHRAYPQGIYQVNGNYSKFLESREEFLEVQDRQREALATKVRREVEWLRRGPKARTGKSRARISSAGQLIERFSEATERSRTGIAQIEFAATDRKTKRLIEAEGIRKTLGALLFRDLDLTLSPGQRVGLVGANGSGKTTLLKILEGALDPDEGTIRRADRLRIVTFAQDRAAHLDPQISLRRTLCPDGDMVLYGDRLIHVAGWAKRFLFRSDQLDLPVAKLSGGERARVAIAKLMLTPADVLLLDEPTNDLDIPTLEALEENLLEFAGAVVLVSHDRYLLDRVSTTVLALDGGSAQVFADYSQWEASRRDPVPDKTPIVKEPRSASATSAPKKLSYLEQREWDAMEGQILEAERDLSHWQRQLEQPSGDGKHLADAYEKLQAAQLRVATLFDRWAELERKIAN
jgi:ABC transport system ATP-binding/permease protein